MEHIGLIIVLIIIDQVSKYIANKKINNKHIYSLFSGELRFILVKNTGAAFSLLKNRRKLLIFITLPLVCMMFVLLIIIKDIDGTLILEVAISFIIGGAVGNLIDRIRLGYVIDFIHINKKRCPVFNFADIFIITGSLQIIYIIIFTDILS